MTAWITAMILSEDYQRDLAKVAQRLRSSRENRSGQCERCGVCCWQRPPSLSRADLARLSQWRRLEPRAFFLRFCVVDDPGPHTLGPVLRRRHQKALRGQWLPMRETYSIASPCVFLGRDGCVCHDVKPEECTAAQCWGKEERSTDYGWTRDELTALGWDGHRFDPEEWDD